MIQQKHLVSVVIPAYNGARFIRQTIESIRAQKNDLIEIIVIDDGSTDATGKTVAALGKDIRYQYQKNQGPAAARNAGILMSKGAFIAFLDADDIWPAGRLHAMLTEFKKNQNLEIVMGHVESLINNAPETFPRRLMMPHILPVFGCGLFKRQVFNSNGLLDPALRCSEDQDWFLRAKEQKILIKIIKATTLKKRIHEDSMTDGTQWKDVDILKVLKKSLDRRREDDAIAELPQLSDYAKED